MKKNQQKRLSLSSETIKVIELNPVQLVAVAGGWSGPCPSNPGASACRACTWG